MSEILDALKFAAIGIANKDYVPDLCHYQIRHGVVSSFDGVMSVQSPIPVELAARPKAKDLLKAVAICIETKDPLSLYTTVAGKLGLKAGSFRALVECLPEDAAQVFPIPEGSVLPASEDTIGLFYSTLCAMAPFMAVDASRAWALGLRVNGGMSYVTNNVILVQAWHGLNFPHECILPKSAVLELVRIRKPPTKIQVAKGSVTFWYGDRRFVRTQLVDGQWPENVDSIFDKAHATDAQLTKFPEGFFSGLDRLLKFSDDRDRIYFRDNIMATHAEDAEGAAVGLHVAGAGLFNGKQLAALQGVATSIAFDSYPAPVPFVGQRMRGVLVGMRQ